MLIDRISPVVIKEIRQGLKSKIFSGSFLLLQGLMVLCVLLYLITLRQRSDVSFINGLFWFFLGLPLLVILPLRGFQTVYEEHKSKTLELLYLTRLSAWQIVFGKWMALFIQALLILVAVLPYLVLRYFLGGINIVEDLANVGILLLGAALLVGLGVGMSAIQSRLLRALILIGAFLQLYIMPMMIVSMSFSGRSTGPAALFTSVWSTLWIVGVCLVLLVLLLEYGASLIAPPAENHALRKRLLTLAVFFGCSAIAVMLTESSLLAIPMLLLVPVGLDMLCESPRYIGRIYRPSRYVPRLARLAMRLFYPGWPSGVLCLLLLAGLLAGVTAGAFPSESDDILSILVLLVGALVSPLAVILLVKPRLRRIARAYLVLQLALAIFTLIMVTVKEISRWGDMLWLEAIPTSGLLLNMTGNDGVDEAVILNAAITGASLVILLVRSRPFWARARELERRAREARA